MVHTATLDTAGLCIWGWVWQLGFAEPLAASGHCHAAWAAAQQNTLNVKTEERHKGETTAVLESPRAHHSYIPQLYGVQLTSALIPFPPPWLRRGRMDRGRRR